MVKKSIEASQTKLFAVYFHELAWLCQEIEKNCEAVFRQTALPATGYFIRTDPDLHARLQAVLAGALRLRKLLWTDPKRLNEAFEVYSLRQERVRVMQDLLQGIDLEELLDTKIRSVFEEFDLDLDETNIELSLYPPQAGGMAVYNIVLSHWEAISQRVIPLRVYIACEGKLYSTRWSVDLKRIQAEARAILQRLKALNIYSDESPRGLMIPAG